MGGTVTQVMQEINKALSISTKLSTYFHPQTDGQTKIVNKEVQKFLQIYCFDKQDQWANWLAIAQFSINSKKHTSTKHPLKQHGFIYLKWELNLLL